MKTIKMCLGSSCFARGNDELLSFVKKYIADNKLNGKVELTGCRCEHLCADGPNVFIDNEKYTNVTEQKLVEILEKL